jgi:hypothetical protein
MTPDTVVKLLHELASNTPSRPQRQFLHEAAACVAALLSPIEPAAGDRITDLHVWIATMMDGSEGIIAGGIPGLGMSTLMSSRRHVAVQLGQYARDVQAMAQESVKSFRLVTFTSTEGTRQ